MASIWDTDFYRERLLNLVNKNPRSLTYGCVDRGYWGWKNRDFPDLSKQYAVLSLVLLETQDYADVCTGMIKFVQKRLQKNGSADQCFPRENSAGPTLYLMNGILQARPYLQKILPDMALAAMDDMIVKSLSFCIKHKESYGHVANHKALFAHTFLMAKVLVSENEALENLFQQEYDREIGEILDHCADGFFREYETADPGYQSQCLYYLTLCFELTHDDRLEKVIIGSIESAMAYFLFPDGSFSGIFSGRACETFYPYAFIYWANKSQVACNIASFLFDETCGEGLVKWYALDDDNFIRLGTQYLICSNMIGSMTRAPVCRLPFRKVFSRYFEQAGILIHSTKQYYFVGNFKRGGMFKVVNKVTGKCYEDCGVVVSLGGKDWSSNIFCDGNIVWSSAESVWGVSGHLTLVMDHYLTPSKLVLLRALSITFFKIPFFTDFIKSSMVKILFLNKHNSGMKFNRKVSLDEVEITVEDNICDGDGEPARYFEVDIIYPKKHIPFHMASAGYHHKERLVDARDGERYRTVNKAVYRINLNETPSEVRLLERESI